MFGAMVASEKAKGAGAQQSSAEAMECCQKNSVIHHQRRGVQYKYLVRRTNDYV